jgi:hypothetical protein
MLLRLDVRFGSKADVTLLKFRCPLYPQKRTFQSATKNRPYFNHLAGKGYGTPAAQYHIAAQILSFLG